MRVFWGKRFLAYKRGNEKVNSLNRNASDSEKKKQRHMWLYIYILQ